MAPSKEQVKNTFRGEYLSATVNRAKKVSLQ